MGEFVIKDVESSASIQFEGEIPRGLTGYDGCSFVIRFSSMPLNAAVDAYDIRPDRWADFFADIAENWRGWKGTKEHASLEGHLRLEATSDSSGHIRLFIELRGVEVANVWVAKASIGLEAGQLEGLARSARVFFG